MTIKKPHRGLGLEVDLDFDDGFFDGLVVDFDAGLVKVVWIDQAEITAG